MGDKTGSPPCGPSQKGASGRSVRTSDKAAAAVGVAQPQRRRGAGIDGIACVRIEQANWNWG